MDSKWTLTVPPKFGWESIWNTRGTDKTSQILLRIWLDLDPVDPIESGWKNQIQSESGQKI